MVEFVMSQERVTSRSGLNLPEERRKTAEYTADLILTAYATGRTLDELFIEETASHIHEAWLQRNAERAAPEERCPYAELSDSEKEKDHVFVRAGIEGLKSLT